MDKDDDILAALPQPPLPAPARREAAIAEALRRFDGGAPSRPAAGPRREPAPWPTWFNRPNSGALAGALLVALIALPLAWTSLPDQARDGGRDTPTASVERERASGPAMANASPSDPASVVPPRPSPGDPETEKETAAAADSIAEPSAAEPAPGPLPAPSAEPASKTSGPNEQAFAETETSGEIVVTGARIARPNLTSSSPVTVVGEERVALAGRRAAARRGDWNACTIDDPGRNLGGCRASSRIAPGLARAWEDDLEGAIQAFDAVIAADPRSSAAYLNRGMIHRRRGELQPALADLDRAVRYAPRAARNYYHRSLVLRQLGDVRRARADEARAVDLDPRYAVVVPAGR